MAQDSMYKNQPRFFAELYGDDLFEEKSGAAPRDSNMFHADTPVMYLDFIYNNTEKNKIEDIQLEFDKLISRDEFSAFKKAPNIKYSIAYDNEDVKKTIISDCPFVLVHKNTSKSYSYFNTMKQSNVLLCIPFSMVNLMSDTNGILINKIYLDNHTNQDTISRLVGTFRSPVAITHNKVNYHFDKSNCTIFNDNWFIIQMTVNSSFLFKT